MNTSKILLVVGHVLFWLFNYWLIAFGTDLNWNGFSSYTETLAYAYSYGLFFNAVLFYLQVFWLFPRIYKCNRRVNFYLLSIVIIVGVTLLETYFDYVIYRVYAIKGEPLMGTLISNFLVHLIYTVGGFYYALKFEFKKSEKVKQKLLEENYKAELKYLKAQLNPHFLFNGINNIYHLIGKNDALAKETLLQFSDLLRYQLYESNTNILLEKELDYVFKYIKIEETRKGEDLQLSYDIKLENPKLKIAPLLLIPFVENAFKHCSNHLNSSINTIQIEIEEVGGNLNLKIVNSYDNLVSKNMAGGIGLNNVQKRLLLQYPNAHQLHITKDNAYFIVKLSISL